MDLRRRAFCTEGSLKNGEIERLQLFLPQMSNREWLKRQCHEADNIRLHLHLVYQLFTMKKRILQKSFLFLLPLVFTGAAWADQFTLLIYETKADLTARTDPEKAPGYWAAYGEYAQALTQAGILRGGTALPGNVGVRSVRLMDGKPAESVATDTADGLELGGYFIIEVADMTAALDWAKKSPGITTGVVEVRPHFINPTMPAK